MFIRLAVLIALVATVGDACAQWAVRGNRVELTWSAGGVETSGFATALPGTGYTVPIRDARGQDVGELAGIDGRVFLYTTPAGVVFGLRADGTMSFGFVGRWAMRSFENENVIVVNVKAKTSDTAYGRGFLRKFPIEGETVPMFRATPGQPIARAPIDGFARTIAGNTYVYGNDATRIAAQLLPSGNLLPSADFIAPWPVTGTPGSAPAVATGTSGAGTDASGTSTAPRSSTSLLNIGSGSAASSSSGSTAVRPAGASPVSPTTTPAGGTTTANRPATTRPIPPPPILGAPAATLTPPSPDRPTPRS